MGYTRSHSTRENIAGQIMKALLLLLVFSQSSHGRPQIGNTEPEQQSIVSLHSGQQQFMNRLLQQIESNTTTNFVLSPHSIHSVFSQLLQGSGGRTKEELESLLGVRASDSLVDQERQMEILELPYEDPNRSMLIVLPNAGTSTQDLVQRLGGLDLASIRTNGKLAKTSIFIPKFKLKFKTYLKQQMEALGVRDLFAQSANLTGISDEALSASEAVHQAFIEVNEEGTEAAAATAAVVGLRTAQQRKREFFADRPFLFVVYDFEHEVTLFAGKVVNPNNDNVIQTRAALIQEPGTAPASPSVADSAVCSKMFRDFPNSLDNSNICNKVATEGKKLDWLRKNRALCEESKDFFDNFQSKSCGSLWCDYAAPQLADWSAEANSSGVGGCQGVEGRVESVQTKRRCKTVKNKLKAAEFLQCRS